MFDEAAQVLEEIEPEEKTRNEVLGARVDIYMAAKKWDMAAAVASHLVKVDPQTADWWISLAYALDAPKALRRQSILLRAQATSHNALFNLRCERSRAAWKPEPLWDWIRWPGVDPDQKTSPRLALKSRKNPAGQ